MSRLLFILIICTSLLVIFIQSTFPLLRHQLGAQLDLLPGLMVYAGIHASLGNLTLVSIMAGLWFDALSSNPLGTSIPGLFLVAFIVRGFREILVHHDPSVQAMLGLGAGLIVPVISVLLLLSMDQEPMLGWKSLWQLLIVAIGSTLTTPAFFMFFHRLHRLFSYPSVTQSSFRPDREIKRGRF